MDLAAPRDTLRHHLARPLCRARDASGVHAPVVAQGTSWRLTEFGGSDMRRPSVEAVRFYMHQHAMALVRRRVGLDEPLGDLLGVVESYHREMGELAQRQFVYLMMICIRESRHAERTRLGGYVSKLFGAAADAFSKSVVAHTKGEAAVSEWHTSPPDCSLGVFTASLIYVFRHGYPSCAFGGEPWARVAECLHRFVTGELSAEAMLDTSFTLAHNGGPIFDKGMVWRGVDEMFLLLLDVQASGQIPQLVEDAVAEKKGGGQHNPHNPVLTVGEWEVLASEWRMLRDVLGGEFGGHMDWARVTPSHAKQAYAIKQALKWQTKHAAPAPADLDGHLVVDAFGAKVKKEPRKK